MRERPPPNGEPRPDETAQLAGRDCAPTLDPTEHRQHHTGTSVPLLRKERQDNLGSRSTEEFDMSTPPTPAESDEPSPAGADTGNVTERSVPTPTKTPFFQAINAERYR